MKNRLWLFSVLILGSVGYGLLWYLFPRFDNSTKIHLQLDRAQSIAQAAEFLTQNGYDVSGWDAGISTEDDEETIAYLQAHSLAETEAKILAPLRFKIKFSQNNRPLNVFLAPSGQVIGFKKVGTRPPKEVASTSSFSKAEAQRSFNEILGDTALGFQFISESEPEKGSKKFSWKHTSSEDPALTIRAEAIYTGNKLTEFDLKPNIPDAYKLPRTKSTAALDSLAITILVLIFITACVFYFLNLNRKAIDHRASLVFFGIIFFITLIVNFLTNVSQDIGVNDGGGPPISPFIRQGIASLTVAAFSLGFALFMGLAWSSGEAYHAKNKAGRFAVMTSFLRGNWYSKRFAESLLAGFFGGGITVVIPFLTAFLLPLSSLPHLLTDANNAYNSVSPFWTVALGSIVQGNFFFLTLLFSFLFPVLRVYLKSRWVFALVIVFLGILFLTDSNTLTSKYSLVLKFVIAAVILNIFFLLYLKFDYFSVLAANAAATLSLKALSLYHQPSPFVHSTGVKALVALGLGLLVSLVLTQLAPDKEIVERELPNSDEDQDERARLLAEFGVARKAQEKLLPSEAPFIPGFDIAALCRPARECAGDLYDFLELQDGKLGIVVADVSGKGVPAALYMTLTKGLLTSISETRSDPGEILREVNKHLYEVCKRKSFVTLALGVLDPETKTMTYARAGHNPSLWRNATKHKWLKPSGIGLGLNSGKTFDRLLKVETLQLATNDILVFYSDGITEAMNKEQEEYGEDRLLTATKTTDGLSATETMNAIMLDVGNFLGEIHPQDDQTLMVVHVK